MTHHSKVGAIVSLPVGPGRLTLLVLAALAVCLALFWTSWTVLLWSRWHPTMPWRDLFVIVDGLRPLLAGSGQAADWLALLEPHYAAHRIAVPRVLVALDLLFFGGGNGPLYVAGWLSILTLLVLYRRLACAGLGHDRLLVVLGAAMAVTWMFAPAHLWNITNAINTSWHLCFALAALAFALLLREPSPPSAARWVLAYVLVSLAALSNFAGVIAWLLLPLLAPPGHWRTLAVTAIASLVLTFLYSNGLASDAQIAARWDSGDPAAAAAVRETAEAAIAANDPLRIVHRAARLLCWPLSAEHPLLAGLVFALSLIPAVLVGWQWLHSWVTGRPAPHRWQRFCLLLAATAIGVALAVQLGRLIEQPNYAHGPSFERYNTVVAVYWMGITGLLLSALTRLSARLRAGSVAALLLVQLALLVPGGTYLQQEIASLQTAARLYAAGETPALRDKVDRKLLRFKPEYVYSFDDLFDSRELAYARAPALVPGARTTCSPHQVQVTVTDAPRPGFTAIRVTLQGAIHYPVRELLLADHGSLVARLYPAHEGDFTPLALVSPADNVWVGLATNRLLPPGELLISFQLLGGGAFGCILPAQARKAPAEPTAN